MSDLQDLIHRHKEFQSQLASERPSAIAAVRETVKLFDLSPEECGFSALNVPARRTPPAKYRNEDGHEWSGRGRAPAWVREHLTRGESIDKYLINKGRAK